MIGNQPSKLDEKNRLVIPAKMRGELGDHFFVTVGAVCGLPCLTIYSEEQWQAIMDKYDALSPGDQAEEAALIFMNASECNMDKMGRISLSPYQMEYAGIRREVVVSGRSKHADIWDVDTFKVCQEQKAMPKNLIEVMKRM